MMAVGYWGEGGEDVRVCGCADRSSRGCIILHCIWQPCATPQAFAADYGEQRLAEGEAGQRLGADLR
jgi:hypothetical protein